MYSHLKFQGMLMLVVGAIRPFWAWLRVYLTIINGELARRLRGRLYLTLLHIDTVRQHLLFYIDISIKQSL